MLAVAHHKKAQTTAAATAALPYLQKLKSCSDKLRLRQLCCLYTLIAASAAAVTVNPTHAEHAPWSCSRWPTYVSGAQKPHIILLWQFGEDGNVYPEYTSS
jgi:hypothetical protein